MTTALPGRMHISKVLSAFSGLAALSAIGLTLWYVFGDLQNPLPSAFLSGFGEAAPIFRWPFGLLCYLGSGAALALMFLAASRITLVGWSQFIAEEKEKSVKARKAAVRPVGTLVAVSVENSRFLDSATSMIETTNGFYRVFGKVHCAAKGEQVTIQKDYSLSPFGLEWLCFAGQKYQLTK